ncbi:unnamed protein product [Miscanthus lutarioriparius]|uniref:Uncharacterized protein n=1 Tax=Miscanthus lutarioriparius TaxID=422564 RepID=A0A811PYF0_9POAL|nr:unnamed protein product [Miscanthus lutarioriparius]
MAAGRRTAPRSPPWPAAARGVVGVGLGRIARRLVAIWSGRATDKNLQETYLFILTLQGQKEECRKRRWFDHDAGGALSSGRLTIYCQEETDIPGLPDKEARAARLLGDSSSSRACIKTGSSSSSRAPPRQQQRQQQQQQRTCDTANALSGRGDSTSSSAALISLPRTSLSTKSRSALPQASARLSADAGEPQLSADAGDARPQVWARTLGSSGSVESGRRRSGRSRSRADARDARDRAWARTPGPVTMLRGRRRCSC